MASPETLVTFVDTSGWYAAFVTTDANYSLADVWLGTYKGKLLTTDYVIDETLTLMRARGHRIVATRFGGGVFAGNLAVVHYLTPAEITAAWDAFQRFADKDWSFTDCTSKVVIEALSLTHAFSFDQHFRQFGTVAVVP